MQVDECCQATCGVDKVGKAPRPTKLGLHNYLCLVVYECQDLAMLSCRDLEEGMFLYVVMLARSSVGRYAIPLKKAGDVGG